MIPFNPFPLQCATAWFSSMLYTRIYAFGFLIGGRVDGDWGLSSSLLMNGPFALKPTPNRSPLLHLSISRVHPNKTLIAESWAPFRVIALGRSLLQQEPWPFDWHRLARICRQSLCRQHRGRAPPWPFAIVPAYFFAPSVPRGHVRGLRLPPLPFPFLGAFLQCKSQSDQSLHVPFAKDQSPGSHCGSLATAQHNYPRTRPMTRTSLGFCAGGPDLY